MAKREQILRQLLIINKLKQKEVDYEEIADYLQRESELRTYDLTLSKRNFSRELEHIRSLYDVDIQFNHSRKVYAIVENQMTPLQERLFESLEMLELLRTSENLSAHIHFEPRQAQGWQHFTPLLQAIRQQNCIRFVYQRFQGDEPVERTVAPLGLREFKGRWYLIGKDAHDQRTKIYGLDRLLEITTLQQKFTLETPFDIESYFRHCYGILRPDAEAKPEEVILHFTAVQGKYIQAQPLHPSQELIAEDETGMRFRLYVYTTYDFLQALLSFGETLQVIASESLRLELREKIEIMLGNTA
jgi:hypothetical protein